MGHKLLIPLAFVTFAFAAGPVHYPDIDKLIEQVKYKRIGLSKSEIAKLKDPFIDEKKLQKIIVKQKIIKHRKKVRVTYRLSSIMNDRAKINGRWYHVGQKVGSYRLAYVDPFKGFAVLKRGKRTLRLYLHRRKLRLIKFGSGV